MNSQSFSIVPRWYIRDAATTVLWCHARVISSAIAISRFRVQTLSIPMKWFIAKIMEKLEAVSAGFDQLEFS